MYLLADIVWSFGAAHNIILSTFFYNDHNQNVNFDGFVVDFNWFFSSSPIFSLQLPELLDLERRHFSKNLALLLLYHCLWRNVIVIWINLFPEFLISLLQFAIEHQIFFFFFSFENTFWIISIIHLSFLLPVSYAHLYDPS